MHYVYLYHFSAIPSPAMTAFNFSQALASMIIADRFAATDYNGRGMTQQQTNGGCMAYPNRQAFPRRQPRRFPSLAQAQSYLELLGPLPVAPAAVASPAAKAATGYTIGKRHYTQRANANGYGVSEFEWVHDTYYGIYPTNLAAKRAYLAVWQPTSTQWSDCMVKAHFDAIARNEKSIKILTTHS